MGVKLRKRKLPSGRIQLYLDVYRYGNRKTEALQMFLDGDKFHNRETQRMADVIRAKRELDLQAQMHGLSATHNRRSSFIRYMEAQGKKRSSGGTRLTWDAAVARVSDFAGESIVFGDITRTFVENFRTYLLKELKASTADVYLGKLKATLNQATRDGIMNMSPASGIVINVQRSLPVFLSLEEIKKLGSTKSSRESYKNAFLFGCFTGLRFSDIKKLEWKDIRDGYIEFTQTKTKFSERLPLSRQAKVILEDQRRIVQSENGCVFLLPHSNSINGWLRRWAKKAGIEKRLSFHKSRHTFATLSIGSGIDLYTTSKLLGHHDLKSTQIYARVVDEKKRQAVDMLPMI